MGKFRMPLGKQPPHAACGRGALRQIDPVHAERVPEPAKQEDGPALAHAYPPVCDMVRGLAGVDSLAASKSWP